jgi:hypothetical protein
VDAGVAGVELGGLGLFCLPASTGAAHDNGDVIGSMVLEEVAMLRGLPSGNDSELGGAVGGDNDSGFEVLAGIKVFDPGRLGESKALSLAGGFGEIRKGPDAGGTGKKSGTEVFDGAADGGNTAEAGNYNAVHLISSSRQPQLVCGDSGGWMVFAELADATHHVANGFDGAEGFIGNFDVKGLFDLEGDIDLVEGVDIEFVEGLVRGD